MEESRKYILLQSEYTLSYNDEDCFVNDKPFKKEGGIMAPKEVCFELQKSFYNTFLKTTRNNYRLSQKLSYNQPAY